ncbi:hypothetical protein [Herbaspirillum frisingense]|uniref:hypothetical protein n=1 Tax=Herbaspirillum frisingense TaxID=92645 RepID=UPI0039AF8E4F
MTLGEFKRWLQICGIFPGGGSSTNLATKTQNLGNVSGALTIDLSQGWNVFFTVTGAITSLTFTNGPAVGAAARVRLQITNGGVGMAWATGTRWTGAGVVASAPTLQASGVENVVYDIARPVNATLYDAAYIGRVA